MFASPGPIAISTRFFSIYWYGIILGLSFLLGEFVIIQAAKREYKEENLTEIICNLAFWVLLGGILGARLYYVLLNLNYYSVNLPEIIMLQNGGISIHGGLLGGIFCGYIYLKKNNLSFFKYADLYALGLPVAQAMGRWGNFFNSEAFGRPTDLPWGVYIPESSRPIMLKNYEYFHPTFLYESLWDIFIFLILFFVIKRLVFKKKGVLFLCYLILYSMGRIFIESIRIDSVFNILGIPVAIWVSVLFIIISLICMKYLIYSKDSKN